MTLNISKALSGFDLAEAVELDCGSFDILIRQAAIHNEGFRAAVAKRALAAKKRSLVPDQGSLTGSFEEDVELFIENILQDWGTRPLKDDDGKKVDFTPENLRTIFTGSRQGKILFTKIQTAAIDDQLFAIREDDLKNS